jgi:hypothetical protein
MQAIVNLGRLMADHLSDGLIRPLFILARPVLWV